MNIGPLIKKAREQSGKTLEDVAKIVGVSPATISRYESGEIKNMRRDKIALLAQALEVSPSYLMGWRDEDGEPILENIPGIITPIKTKRVPILGSIACGEPVFAEENYNGYFLLDTSISSADFILQAKGDSMIDANIFDGDLVFLKKQSDVDNGSIAAVLVEDEATLKKINKSGDVLILQPCNMNYDPIVVSKKDHKSVRILGEMVGVYSSRSK